MDGPAKEPLVVSQGNDFISLLLILAYFLPKNLLSFLVGCLVRVPIPDFAKGFVLGGFVKMFSIDLREAALPLADHGSIEDVFTRALQPDARPVTGDYVSPADGMLARAGEATGDDAIQAKGLTYSLADMILGETADEHPDMGLAHFQTIYLAPHNYHRVHAPAGGQVTRIRYFPGELWPVNAPTVLRLPRLFVRNERLVFELELDDGGTCYVVMVGALNVGRMVTPLAPELTTNSARRQLGLRPRSIIPGEPIGVKAGDEIGTFMLGSTVVLAWDQKAAEHRRLLCTETARPIRMGEPLTESN